MGNNLPPGFQAVQDEQTQKQQQQLPTGFSAVPQGFTPIPGNGQALPQSSGDPIKDFMSGKSNSTDSAANALNYNSQGMSNLTDKFQKAVDPTTYIDMIPGMKDRRVANQQSQDEYYKSNPRPVTGMEDPAYAALGMTSPGMVPGAEKVYSGLKGFLEPAAQRAEVMDKVKDVKSLEPYVAEKVSKAAQDFTDKQITPRMDQQYAKSHEQYVPFNKEDFMGIHPDLDAKVDDLSKYYDSEIPMSKALELRADLNSNTKFKPVGPYADTEAARTKAYASGNSLRESIRNTDPEVGQLSDELKTAYGIKKNALGSSSKNPIGTVLTSDNAAGLAKRGRLASFDEQAGSDLSGLGHDIKTANDRIKPLTLGDVFSIHGPKGVATKIANIGTRPYDALAQKAVPTLQDLLTQPQTMTPADAARYMSRPGSEDK